MAHKEEHREILSYLCRHITIVLVSHHINSFLSNSTKTTITTNNSQTMCPSKAQIYAMISE